jgi:hypothetical protein
MGGNLYPPKTDPLCHLCQSPARGEIERQLMMGFAQRSIWESLPDTVDLKRTVEAGGRGYDYRKFSRHIRSHKPHMPLHAIAARASMEQRALMIGIDLEAVRGTIIDHVTAIDAVIDRGVQDLLTSKVPIDPSTLVRAARAKAQMIQAQATTVDDEIVSAAFAQYLLETRTEMEALPGGREAFARLGDRLRQNPILKALEAQVQRNHEDAYRDPRSVEFEPPDAIEVDLAEA